MSRTRRCRVTMTAVKDTRPIGVSVEVSAQSVYEAALVAYEQLRGDDWVEYVSQETPLRVEVLPDETPVSHQVTVRHVLDWLARPHGTPREVALRGRLQERLGSRGAHPPAVDRRVRRR